MTEDALKAALSQEIRASQGYIGGEIAEERAEAMDRYLGEPYGNEIEGRSEVVMTVTRDTIESTLPEIYEMVAGSDDVVQFEPYGPGDEEQAKQATDYINYVINRDNPGPLIQHDCIKDGLIQKSGTLKVYTENYTKTTPESFEGISDQELVILDGDEELEIEQHSERFIDLPDPQTGEMAKVRVHDVKCKRTTSQTKHCIENVPPEELLVSRREKSWDDPRFIGHWRNDLTRSDLLEMGFDPEVVETLPTAQPSNSYSAEDVARRRHDDPWPIAGSRDRANDPIEVVEGYYKVDFNGDGIAERRKVFVAGLGGKESGLVILSNEEVDDHPFCGWSPVRIPHVLIGLSQADLTMDIEKIESTVWRQTLDNMYGVNSGRLEVAMSHCTVDTINDILLNRPDGVVRTKQPGGLNPIVTQPIIQHSMKVLEGLASVRENRTGNTAYNQGTDANSLNKTARGIGMIMSAAQKRKVMMARLYAEMCLKTLCKKLLKEVIQHQNKPRMVMLRDKWVEVDPRSWNAEMNVTVNVGAQGTKETQGQAAMAILQTHEKIITMQGGFGGLVTEEKAYNACEFMVTTLTGARSGEKYFARPGEAPPPPPKPDPEMMKVEAEKQKIAAQVEGDKIKTQTKVEGEMAKTQAKIAGDQAKLQAQIQGDQAKLQAEIQGQQMQTQAGIQLQQQELAIKERQGAFKPQPKSQEKRK